MIARSDVKRAQERAAKMLDEAGIRLTPRERETIEVADFGLDDLARIGLELVVYANTDRYCAKELVLFPRQTCPEHRHPDVPDESGVGLAKGKMETFRVRRGEVFLYVAGSPVSATRAILPANRETCFTVFHEIVLRPGEQYTIPPDTLHWFQAGEAGAVVSEFSSTSRDEVDVFTDPEIRRLPEVDESR